MTYIPLRAPRHEQLSIRGLTHRLSWWGERSATPIVLLHGFQDCGETWQFLVDCLPDSWSLVALDWRGFGHTDWAAEGYWYPEYLADLDELLQVLTPDGPAMLIGHSMGANAVGLYAGIRPQRVKWFVNLEGVGLTPTRPEQAPDRYAQWLDELRAPLPQGRYESIQQLADVLQQRNPRLPPAHAAFVARAWTRDTEGGVQLRFDPRHRLVNPYLYRSDEAEACWKRMQAPMLFVSGGASAIGQRRLEAFSDVYIHSVFANARTVMLPGLGHMMHHEDPRAVAVPIIDFVEQLSAAEPGT